MPPGFLDVTPHTMSPASSPLRKQPARLRHQQVSSASMSAGGDRQNLNDEKEAASGSWEGDSCAPGGAGISIGDELAGLPCDPPGLSDCKAVAAAGGSAGGPGSGAGPPNPWLPHSGDPAGREEGSGRGRQVLCASASATAVHARRQQSARTPALASSSAKDAHPAPTGKGCLGYWAVCSVQQPSQHRRACARASNLHR